MIPMILGEWSYYLDVDILEERARVLPEDLFIRLKRCSQVYTVANRVTDLHLRWAVSYTHLRAHET